jgi:DNA mismatch endonuclease, patch repair protein
MKGRSKSRGPSFAGLQPASAVSSRRASQGSAKRNTRPEKALQRHLRARGLRFRTDVAEVQGRPDIVFARSKLVVFVDGDFWHGRRLKARLARLVTGHNADYWVRKVLTNRARDRRTRDALRRLGWKVIRAWESDIKRDIGRIGEKIALLIDARANVSREPTRQALARKRATAP